MLPLLLSYTAILDNFPRCCECNDAANYAYGWNTLCLQCTLKLLPLKCDQCKSTDIAISNHIAFDAITTTHSCIKCLGQDPHNFATNLVRISLAPQNLNEPWDAVAVIQHAIRSPRCFQCRQANVNGAYAYPLGSGSVCRRCLLIGTLHSPHILVTIESMGRFLGDQP